MRAHHLLRTRSEQCPIDEPEGLSRCFHTTRYPRRHCEIREAAETNVRLTIAKAERGRKLDGTGAISKEEYETAINAAEVAQAQLKRDDAAVDYAKFEVS